MSVSKVLFPYLLIVVSIAVFLVWLFGFNQPLFLNTLPEFIAGFLSGILGIMLGFEIDRSREASQQQKRIRIMLHSFRDEMELNYGRLKTLQTLVGKGEECFMLFDTTMWKRFGNQLDSFKDFQFVLSLGYYYSELDHLNEAMKKDSSAIILKSFYANYPHFNGIDEFLESLKKSSIGFQKYIEEYFWTSGKMDKK